MRSLRKGFPTLFPIKCLRPFEIWLLSHSVLIKNESVSLSIAQRFLVQAATTSKLFGR
jgi:hypothetical protein